MSKHETNVTVDSTRVRDDADYIPMTLPQQRLAVPPIPGYHTHWMMNTPERVATALRAGYEFVTSEEVNLNNFDLGGDAKTDGNTDMGTRVTVLASSYGDGSIGRDGQPARLILMKQREELYRKHQKHLENRNDGIADALTSSFKQGTVGGRAEGETSEDMGKRYVGNRGKIPDLFNRHKLRRTSG